jgi:uncharacterized membrane protein YbhN (UPF0104 family)
MAVNVEAHSKHRRARLILAAKAVALLVFLGLLVRALLHADWAGASSRLSSVGPAALLVLVPYPLMLALDAFGWKLILARLGLRVPLAPLFRVRVATEAVSSGLPAGGIAAEALTPFLMKPHAPMADALTSSATKRWLIIRTHGYYVLLAFAIGFGTLSDRSRPLLHNDSLPWIVLGCGLGLVALSLVFENATTRLGLAARLHDGIARLRESRFFRRLGVHDLPRVAFEKVDADLARLGKGKHPLPSLLLLAGWLCESVETWFILAALGVNVPFVVVLSFDASLSVVRTVAAFAPAGLGALDLGYLAFFEAYGIPSPAAIGPAFLVLRRSKDVLYVAIGFVLILLFSRRDEPVLEAA